MGLLTVKMGPGLLPVGNHQSIKECRMAHKKVERKKELDRRRKRREKRLKARIKEAKEGGAS